MARSSRLVLSPARTMGRLLGSGATIRWADDVSQLLPVHVGPPDRRQHDWNAIREGATTNRAPRPHRYCFRSEGHAETRPGPLRGDRGHGWKMAGTRLRPLARGVRRASGELRGLTIAASGRLRLTRLFAATADRQRCGRGPVLPGRPRVGTRRRPAHARRRSRGTRPGRPDADPRRATCNGSASPSNRKSPLRVPTNAKLPTARTVTPPPARGTGVPQPDRIRTAAADQPNVKQKSSTPGSRNSTSKTRSEIGAGWRMSW
jgi:hypothetical protein